MTIAEILDLALEASLCLIVFSIGLDAGPRDFNYLLRHPAVFVRSVFAMNIVMLVFTVCVSLVFNIHPAVKIALIALAVSPVPPHLAEKKKLPPGSLDYMLGLILSAAVAAIAIIPLSMELLGWIFGASLHMPIGRIFSIVFTSLFAPLGAGMLVRQLRPDFAERIARPVSRAGTIVLYVMLPPILLFSAKAIAVLVGNGVLIFSLLFVVAGLAAGHLLGGPDPCNRAALAVATARRHPGMAIAIASINFPDQKAVPAVVVCCLVFGMLVSAAYMRWQRRYFVSPA